MTRLTHQVYTGLYCVMLLMRHAIVDLKNTGTAGREFLLSFTENGCQVPPEVIVVPQAPLPVNITISFPAWLSVDDISRTIDLGVDHVSLLLPVHCRTVSDVVENKGIRVASSDDVTVYSINHGNGTTDPFVVYPITALGTTYRAASYNLNDIYYSQVALVAAHNDTHVTITLPVVHRNMALPIGNITYMEGDSIEVKLQEYQTLTLDSKHDLTGLKITSTNPIALQSSNTGGTVISLILSNDREFSRQSASPPASRSTGIFSYNQGAAPAPWINYYGEQILPVKHWGRHFVAVTFHSMDVFRIQANTDKTSVLVHKRRSTSSYFLSAGDHADVVVSKRDFIAITSNFPILVIQYTTLRNGYAINQNYYMTTVPPLERCIRDHQYPAFRYQADPGSSFYVIIPTSQKDGVLFNNKSLTDQSNTFPIKTTQITVPGYNVTAIRVTVHHPGVYHISHSYETDVCMCVTARGFPVDMNMDDMTLDKKLFTEPSASPLPWPKVLSSSSSPAHYDVLPLVSAHQDQPVVINKAAISNNPQTRHTWQTQQSNHLGEGFNATVIAVIVSLATAVFFVIACIVGFVVAEFACGRESIFSGAKVSPIEEQ